MIFDTRTSSDWKVSPKLKLAGRITGLSAQVVNVELQVGLTTLLLKLLTSRNKSLLPVPLPRSFIFRPGSVSPPCPSPSRSTVPDMRALNGGRLAKVAISEVWRFHGRLTRPLKVNRCLASLESGPWNLNHASASSGVPPLWKKPVRLESA